MRTWERHIVIDLVAWERPKSAKPILQPRGAYNDRYQRLNKLSDLSKSIEYKSRALALTPVGHPSLANRHDDLGLLYTDLYRQLGKADDLDKSIECYSRALELTPDGHPDLQYRTHPEDHADLPDRYGAIGASYSDRYRCQGKMKDLEKAIECYARALALTPDDHPELQSGTIILSMELFSLALELTPNDNLDLPIRYANLGVSYSDRYRRLGEVTDLEKAIEHKRHALALSSDGHPNIPAWRPREPIDCFSRALSLTPNGHPDLPCRHTNIGIAYSDRYKRLGKLSDLEEAIEYYSHSVTLTPKDHPDLPRRHADLGMSYNERHRRLSEFDDLMKSIQCMSDALELTPEDHPDLADRHADLAGSYGDLYVRLGNLSDLEKAIECSYRALTLTPDGHRGYVFDSALRWAKLASEHSYLNPIEAFRTTIDLLPYFIWLGATASQRYQDLSLADNLAVRAAFAAIQSSNYNLALEWSEHARCIVWNQSLVLRSPLDVLKVSHPDLAIQLQSIAYQLHHASTLSPASCENSSSKNDSEHRHFLAREYNKLLVQAREQPGFEGFLQAPKLNDLIKAAKIGPIIVINCYDVH
ncbi:TPR-like protein, partial [Rhizoctonia solani]